MNNIESEERTINLISRIANHCEDLVLKMIEENLKFYDFHQDFVKVFNYINKIMYIEQNNKVTFLSYEL